MKHIYIICLTLSSFFIYKPLYAEQKTQQYAFFLPNDAFQDNSTITQINEMKPRYNKEPEQNTPLKKNKPNIISQKNPKISLPYEKKTIIINPHPTDKKPQHHNDRFPQKRPDFKPRPRPIHRPDRPIISPYIREKLKQYTLDEDFPETQTYGEEIIIEQPLSLEQFKQKSVSEMLDEMPYPDYNLPSFKQLYGHYIMELRSLYDNGYLPDNQGQEAVLQKASNIGYFNVR